MRRLLSPRKLSDVAKNLQENFLGHVAGIRLIVEKAIGQVVYRRLKTFDQLLIGALVAGLQSGDQAVIFEHGFLFGGQIRVEIKVIVSCQCRSRVCLELPQL